MVSVLPPQVLHYISDLEQDCSNSIANALELLQSCTKPSYGNVYSITLQLFGAIIQI